MTTLIAPRVHDLGGFQVRRAVPSLQARSVGPFVFVDHMGPPISMPDTAWTCARIRTSAWPR
jgi:redox-sensitive bicupin YhaK (pirin superfamily)